MKHVELRLLSELMKNSRRSDRALARAAGASQPTVSRMMRKLEKEDYIRGYTIIPGFEKIGFKILAFTFAKLKHPFTPEDLIKARENVRETLNMECSPVILGMSGIGCDADRILVSLHEDYSAYRNFVRFIRSQPLVEVDGVKSFLIDLVDEKHFLPLNFTSIAGYLLRNKGLTERTNKP